MSDKSMFDKLADAAAKNPLDAVSDKDLEKLDTDYSGGSSSSMLSTSNKRNPHDTKGSGYSDDEDNDIPGEQNGNELDVHAENRPRKPNGEFI